MRAIDLMTTPAITCHVNDTLRLAANRMKDGDVGALPVVNDEGKLTGMVTDRDICMAACVQGRALDDILVHVAMTHPVVTARPDQSVEEVEDLMASHQIRRVPVIDAHGRPIGVLSLNDLAIESVAPDTGIQRGTTKLAFTLAAISEHRPPSERIR